jgi:hypothetical protein
MPAIAGRFNFSRPPHVDSHGPPDPFPIPLGWAINGSLNHDCANLAPNNGWTRYFSAKYI